MVHFKTYKQFVSILENHHNVTDKEELLGKKMYHGTTLKSWNEPFPFNYIHVTDNIELAKYFSVGRAEGDVFSDYSKTKGEPSTGIIFEITIDEDIIKLDWEQDADYEWMKTWQDSYNEIGRFVIIGDYDTSKFKEIYREVVTSESEIKYDY